MLLIVLVFVGVFAVTALLIAAGGSGRAEQMKKTLSRLDAVLATAGKAAQEELVDIRKTELFSSIPFLNRLLLRLEIATRFRRLLYQADLDWTPGKLVLLALAAWGGSCCVINLRIGVFALSMLFALLPAALPFIYVFWKRSKRLQKFQEGLPAALDLLVSGLRGGHSLVSALGMVGREAPDPIGREFRVCFDEQNYGLELRTAMENLASRVPLQDIRIVMTAILIQKETGGNLAEVLEKCAHIIRERFRLQREIRTRTAQGRLSGWVLSLLPPILGFLLYLIRPEGMRPLWTRPQGLKLIYASLTMTLIGSLIIRKIVRIRV